MSDKLVAVRTFTHVLVNCGDYFLRLQTLAFLIKQPFVFKSIHWFVSPVHLFCSLGIIVFLQQYFRILLSTLMLICRTLFVLTENPKLHLDYLRKHC